MQNLNKKISYAHSPLVEEIKIKRIEPYRRTPPGLVFLHPRYRKPKREEKIDTKEKVITMPEEEVKSIETESKNNVLEFRFNNILNKFKSFFLPATDSVNGSLLTRVINFIQTEEALLLMLILVLIIEKAGDDMLIMMMAYLLIFGI